MEEAIQNMYNNLLSPFTEMSKEILGNNLVGIYLHGSAAMGCFNPQKSDLDLILIVEDEISNVVKMEFMKRVAELNEQAPAKGIELSIVKKEFCKPFVYPTPFELHFSVMHLNWFHENPEDYIEKMKGADKDLAAHFTIIYKYGIVLFGDKISEVFGEIPKEDYIDSIWSDIEGACEEILADPMYITLNLCRVLAYLQEKLVLSKKEGGEWGLNGLPQKFRALIQEALHSYASDEEMITDSETPQDFAKYMLAQIEEDRADLPDIIFRTIS